MSEIDWTKPIGTIAKQPDTWIPDARTVSEIADWLEAEYPHSTSAMYVRKTWGKDPATALVDEYEPDTYAREALIAFADWLIKEGRVK